MASRVRHASAEDTIRELRKDFEKKLAEISSSIESGGDTTADEMLQAMRKEIDRRMTEVRGRLEESIEMGRAAVNERPFLFIGAALGVGVLIGLLLGRKNKD